MLSIVTDGGAALRTMAAASSALCFEANTTIDVPCAPSALRAQYPRTTPGICLTRGTVCSRRMAELGAGPVGVLDHPERRRAFRSNSASRTGRYAAYMDSMINGTKTMYFAELVAVQAISWVRVRKTRVACQRV